MKAGLTRFVVSTTPAGRHDCPKFEMSTDRGRTKKKEKRDREKERREKPLQRCRGQRPKWHWRYFSSMACKPWDCHLHSGTQQDKHETEGYLCCEDVASVNQTISNRFWVVNRKGKFVLQVFCVILDTFLLFFRKLIFCFNIQYHVQSEVIVRHLSI